MFECRPLLLAFPVCRGHHPGMSPLHQLQPISLTHLAPTHLLQTQAPKAAADPDQDARDAVATGLHL